MNTDIFIKKSSDLHSNFYTYEKSIYISNKTPIIITCPIHGDFLQSPNNDDINKKLTEIIDEV